MKNLLLILSLLIVSNSYSQSHTFSISKQKLSLSGTIKDVDSYNAQLRVISSSGGKYTVEMKDSTTGYFVGLVVKYSHSEDGFYVYSVVRYDAGFERVTVVASETKLSEIAGGKRAEILLRFGSNDYWYISTK
jgi:hypothetical protein